jgi:hypothetical protein
VTVWRGWRRPIFHSCLRPSHRHMLTLRDRVRGTNDTVWSSTLIVTCRAVADVFVWATFAIGS